MAQIRHLNPYMFQRINELWRMRIGQDNMVKLRFTLVYFTSYLEDYLIECEKRFQMLKKGKLLQ